MRTLILAALISPGIAYGLQDVTNPPVQLSLADMARQSKKTKQQEQPKTVVVADERANPSLPTVEARTPDDRPPQAPSGLPDLILQGGSNIVEIIQSLENIKAQRGPAEAEAALHRWYDKHDAMLLVALQSAEGAKSDPNATNGAQAATNLQNAATSLRIQAAFLRIIGEFPKLGFRPDWFQVHCGEGNFAPCR